MNGQFVCPESYIKSYILKVVKINSVDIVWVSGWEQNIFVNLIFGEKGKSLSWIYNVVEVNRYEVWKSDTRKVELLYSGNWKYERWWRYIKYKI